MHTYGFNVIHAGAWSLAFTSPRTQETALRSIDECLTGLQVSIRIYRHSRRREFASVLRNLLTRTQATLDEDAKREREHKRKQIAETIEDMGEGLTIVMECLDSLLSQLLVREGISASVKHVPEAHSPRFPTSKHH